MLWRILGPLKDLWWKGRERGELGYRRPETDPGVKQWEFQWRLWVFYEVCTVNEHSSIHHTNFRKNYIIYLCRSGKTTISGLNLGCHHFFVDTILLAHSHIFIYILSVAAFMLQQNEIAATETGKPVSLKYLLLALAENNCWLLI